MSVSPFIQATGGIEMDVNQIAKMIEWLDEERRRDKATIATLEERLAQQQDYIDQMQRRMNSVESDQTVMKQDSLPAQRERDIMDQVRQEMRQLLESSESRRLVAEREAERRVELQRENMQRSVRDIGEKMDRIEKQFGLVSGLQTEGDRLTNSMRVLEQRMDDLTKKLEEPDRRLAFLEEQRRTDARRLSEIETELPEQKKQMDTIRPKLTLIEDLTIRNERRIQEFANGERERREQIQQFIDQQQLVMQQRDQQVGDLFKRFAQHDEEMSKNIERFELWEQTHREMKRVIDDFNRIGDRLERRINEVAEMQRLSEERFRQEWNDWRDDDQKRWKQLTLSNDEVWRNHDREFETYVKRLDGIEGTVPSVRESVDRLWQLERARADLYRDRYQTLLRDYDTVGTSTETTIEPVTSGVQNDSGLNGS
jgi:chromosome segregation ATPase